MLPDHLQVYLNDQIPCREQQIAHTAALLDPNIPSLPALVLHGQEATGKSLTAKQTLEALGGQYVIIQSRECITGRHLLERTTLACKEAIEKTGQGPFNDIDGRCENLSVLAVHLQTLLSGCTKFVVVFDGIDRQREAPPTMLQALARLGHIIPCLSVVFIVTAPRPRFLHLTGVPHIEFPAYNKAQSVDVLAQDPLQIFTDEILAELDETRRMECLEDDAWLWRRFCGAVWDSLGKGAARDVVNLRALCERIWLPFVQNIRNGSYGTRDFSRLMVRTRALFQNEDYLRESILPSAPIEERRRNLKMSQDLSYYTKFLLVAAYLASYNPPKTDQTFFMKAHDRQKRKKKGGLPGRPPKRRVINRKLLGPQPFVLERLLAIFHAIVPHTVPTGAADVFTQVSTLAALRMLVKAMPAADVLDSTTKWRVNVGWEYVQGIAKGLRFDVENFMAE